MHRFNTENKQKTTCQYRNYYSPDSTVASAAVDAFKLFSSEECTRDSEFEAEIEGAPAGVERGIGGGLGVP